MIRLAFLAGVLSALAVAALGHAHADEAPACRQMTYGQAVAQGERAAGKFTDYSGVDAAKLLAELNAVPPVTNWAADHILIFDDPETIVVVLALNGCVEAASPIDHARWIAVLHAALGDPT